MRGSSPKGPLSGVPYPLKSSLATGLGVHVIPNLVNWPIFYGGPVWSFYFRIIIICIRSRGGGGVSLKINGYASAFTKSVVKDHFFVVVAHTSLSTSSVKRYGFWCPSHFRLGLTKWNKPLGVQGYILKQKWLFFHVITEITVDVDYLSLLFHCESLSVSLSLKLNYWSQAPLGVWNFLYLRH